MKKGNKWALIFLAASVLLAGGTFAFLLGQDREKPKIRFGNTELVYYSGMAEEELLKDVYAEDKQDGNISNRVVVEKIVPDEAENRVVVYYAVTDLSGNVDKNSRVFPAVFLSGQEEDIGLAGYVETLKTGVLEKKDMDVEEKKDQEEAAPEPSPQAEGNPSPAVTPSPAASPSPTRSPVPVPTRAPGPKASAIPEEASVIPEVSASPEAAERTGQEHGEEEEPDGEEPPVLVLNAAEVTVKAGEGPAWVNLIRTLSDDKDSYETLFHNLSVSKYDRNTPGSYRVTVSTEDSNGNRSNVSNLTIIVE